MYEDISTTKTPFMYCIATVPPSQLDMKIDGGVVSTSEVILDEGHHVFECSTDYSRPVSTITWYYGGAEVPQNDFGILTARALTASISRVSRELTSNECNVKVRCTAVNSAILSKGETALTTTTKLKVISKLKYLTTMRMRLFAS